MNVIVDRVYDSIMNDNARLVKIGKGGRTVLVLTFEYDERVFWFFNRLKHFQIIGDGNTWRYVNGSQVCSEALLRRLQGCWIQFCSNQ